LFNGPPADWDLRREIEAELQLVGDRALYDRLTQVDPVAASRIHPNDTRRLIRALEVFRATGEPISHQQSQFEEGRQANECRVFVLRRQREELHVRIEARVRTMIESGLVDEVRNLIQQGCEFGRTARQAVGYHEALAYLNAEYDRDEMVARITYHTRRFAKRQGTWFRSLSECQFVDIVGDPDPESIVREILHLSHLAPRDSPGTK
jgi:tRNA dimethylallyltransferase